MTAGSTSKSKKEASAEAKAKAEALEKELCGDKAAAAAERQETARVARNTQRREQRALANEAGWSPEQIAALEALAAEWEHLGGGRLDRCRARARRGECCAKARPRTRRRGGCC